MRVSLDNHRRAEGEILSDFPQSKIFFLLEFREFLRFTWMLIAQDCCPRINAGVKSGESGKISENIELKYCVSRAAAYQ